jgi:hypothetical protein
MRAAQGSDKDSVPTTNKAHGASHIQKDTSIDTVHLMPFTHSKGEGTKSHLKAADTLGCLALSPEDKGTHKDGL